MFPRAVRFMFCCLLLDFHDTVCAVRDDDGLTGKNWVNSNLKCNEFEKRIDIAISISFNQNPFTISDGNADFIVV